LDNLLLRCLLAALATGIAGFVVLDADFVVAESLRKLSGAQIRAKFAGMQLTERCIIALSMSATVRSEVLRWE
jgi:hypothetical protein